MSSDPAAGAAGARQSANAGAGRCPPRCPISSTAAAAIVCAVLGLWLAAIAMVVSIALLLYVGLDWAEHLEQGWHRLLFALVPQVLSVIQVFLK